MSTPFGVVIEAFLKRVEKDRDFFNVIKLTSDESMALALKRSENYLHEAIGILSLKGCNQIDFNNVNTETGAFNDELTKDEVYLISSIMYEVHLDRDISKLKIFTVNYTPVELKVFDPSNARSTFRDLFNDLKETNAGLIDEYKNRDRLTGRLLSIKYEQYDG